MAEGAPEGTWRTPLELGLLGAIWGASFLFMRVSAKDFGAVAQVELRLVLGSLVLLPLYWRSRAQLPLTVWPKIALIGVINSALPFMLFTWAAQRAPAGVGAITSGMTVMFTALVGFLFFGERIGPRRAIALFAGFAGVVVLAGGKVAGASIGASVAAGVAASFLYGIGLNLVRRYLTGLPPAAVACAALGSSAVLVSPLALATWPQAAIPWKSWAATAMLGVLCTGLAYVLYYRLIARIGAGKTSAVTYLVPLFGVAWAWLLIDEPLTVAMGVAGVLILGSVAVSQSGGGGIRTGIRVGLDRPFRSGSTAVSARTRSRAAWSATKTGRDPDGQLVAQPRPGAGKRRLAEGRARGHVR